MSSDAASLKRRLQAARLAPPGLLASLLLCGTLQAQSPDQDAIGIVSRAILDVTRRTPAIAWTRAQRGDVLNAGNAVRTGERSIAILKLKDNSLLRIREKSEITLAGGTANNAFQKEVSVEGGTVGFHVQTQRPGEEFRFTTPTSVASIRGTEGSFARNDTADIFTILTGLGRITNLNSLSAADVPAGYTATSRMDGRLDVRPSTEEEKDSAARASDTNGRGRQFRLQMRNPREETRELIIDFLDD
jgi:hypothetical protein